MPKWIVPFKVSKCIGPVAVKLDLPSGMRIHNVFHVSLVKPYKNNGSFKTIDSSIQDDMDGDPIFEVEKILDSRIRKIGSRRLTEYKIRWTFSPIYDSWEPSKILLIRL